MEDVHTARKAARELRRRRDAIWDAIQRTPDFWMTLKPIEEGAVRRIHALMLQHRWEVFFITQRPATDGDTVQRQTQRWLVKQGFDLPSVLVLGGSRGAAAGALRLTYHVDDSAQNCLDVVSDSRAKPILIVPDNDRGDDHQRAEAGHRHRAVARRVPGRAREGDDRADPAGHPRADRDDGRVEVGASCFVYEQVADSILTDFTLTL